MRQRKNHSLLIFVTVLKEYVFNAFEVEAYDYLLKPLDSDHFERTMDRAVSTLAQRTDKSIVIQRGSSCDVVPLAQIMYCEVQGRKVYVHQSDGKIIDYYDNLEKGKILGRRCLKCGNMEWPPVYACNICGHMETEWAEIDGSGEMTMLVCPPS